MRVNAVVKMADSPTQKEIEDGLKDCANSLINIPHSTEELITLLDVKFLTFLSFFMFFTYKVPVLSVCFCALLILIDFILITGRAF